MNRPIRLLGLWVCLAGTTYAFDLLAFMDNAGENDITAVAAKKSKSYIRIQLPNGTFVPESYVFGPGGEWRGEKADSTIDKLKFSDVAHMIAVPLAKQNYVPSRDPGTTKLLIMVYWGTSHGVEHASETADYDYLKEAESHYNQVKMQVGFDPDNIMPSMPNGLAAVAQQAKDQLTTAMAGVAAENHLRDKDDQLNVMMLGYDSWWEATQKYQGTPLSVWRQDMLDEIEEDRYFVVLMAYDFQQLWWKKRHRLLWETRFSIRERHHAFNEDLPAMALYASQYFGQDSNGLIHKQIPLGHVDIGAVKSLGEADALQK